MFVLIPGAGGAAWYWSRLVPVLEARGYEAIAVNLPADDEKAGLARYVDAVVDAIGDRTGLTLVAQSMGGLTAPLVCDRLPVDRLVLLNAMVPNPGETGGEWWDNTGQGEAMRAAARRDGRSTDFNLDEYFLHDLPPDVVAESAVHQRDQADAPFGEPWPMASWPSVPTRCLAGRDDRFFPLEFQNRLARERLGIEPEEIPGGHLAALSHPAELADHLVPT